MNRHHEEVLEILKGRDWMTGQELRAALNRGKWFWNRWSHAGFYNLTYAMIEAGLIDGRCEHRVIDGEGCLVYLFKAV